MAQIKGYIEHKPFTIPIAVVVTLCLAIGGVIWGLSSEIYNYRLTNITVRLKSHEDAIMAIKDLGAIRDITIAELGKDVEYIKDRVDDILSKIDRYIKQ